MLELDLLWIPHSVGGKISHHSEGIKIAPSEKEKKLIVYDLMLVIIQFGLKFPPYVSILSWIEQQKKPLSPIYLINIFCSFFCFIVSYPVYRSALLRLPFAFNDKSLSVPVKATVL